MFDALGVVLIVGVFAGVLGAMGWGYRDERRRELARELVAAPQRAPDASIEQVSSAVPRRATGQRGPLTGLEPGDQPSVGGF
jgi:hypothetical protein